MKKTILFIVLATLCLNFRAQAQNTIHLTGHIIDSANNKPLQGATIKIKATQLSVSTDENGNFSINAEKKPGKLIVSFIGYKPIEVTFSVTNSGPFFIALGGDYSALKEVSVVSTGYQTIPKERATGSFAQPITEMYDARVSTDVVSKLDGITSGLFFNRNTNTTQTGQLDISIRGRSTIFANDQPLIVVDNFPYSGDIGNLNPNDVASITVLKDAAAASIWGVRAGNGVIVITTKKGKLNQPLKVTLNSNVTVIQKPDIKYNPNYTSSSDYINVEEFLFKNGYYDGNLTNNTNYPFVSPVVNILAQQRAGNISSTDVTNQINNLSNNNLLNDISKYLYQNAVNQQYSVNLNGGDEKTTYFFSAGYDNNLQSPKDNNYDRLTLNSNLVFTPVKNLQLSIGINYIQSNTKTDNTISNVLSGNIYPYAQLADAKGNPQQVNTLFRPGFIQSAQSLGYLDWSYSPLKDLGLDNNTTKYGDIRISPGIRYNILKGLSVEGKYQYEQYTSNYRDYESEQTFYTRNLINEYSNVDNNGNVDGYNIPLGGILNQSLTTVTAYNIRGQLSYNQTWHRNSVNAIAGIEQSQTKTDGNSDGTLYGYNDGTGNYSNVDLLTTFALNPQTGYANIPTNAAETGLINRVRSYFGNAAYTYDNKYTFSASGRIDGSNYFGVSTNLKSVPLWSTGLKWAIDKEPFYRIDWIPVLRLRATYGYNGNLNQNITGITTFMYRPVNSSYTGLTQAYVANIGDPELTWEKAGIGNLGLDFALKNNILSGSLEYFKKNGEDIIGNESVPPSTGLTTFAGNYASMKGNGFDIQLTSKNIDKGVKWFTTLLFSHATDKVTQYNAPIIPSALTTADGAGGSTYPVIGYPVYGEWSYRWAGLDPTNGDPQGYINGKISKDYSSLTNPVSQSDLVYSGPARPQYYGGVNNRIKYKNLSLDFNLSYKFDYYFRRSSLNYSTLFNSWLGGNKEFAQRWQKPGDEKVTNVPSMVYPDYPSRDQFYQYSTATVEKGDNIRLQDISLSYSFTKKQYRQLPFDNVQIFVYANNLGIIWRANKLGLDPDNPTGYPSPRSISFGFKTNF
ncbi:SusC/RagA family TonB-linked outer membrane protein [Mucilaginibacter sp. L196]|uniref:SusC/RagA family TonB-linked outer membrane protein n=1 Tax=Mucilaginibacter sp. L196 TaxID=1641870 RepID=UPI00131D0791|nr:SusC/RagA family TonB-linked outer membrane protein [Mucilaginibacter sp. L196]